MTIWQNWGLNIKCSHHGTSLTGTTFVTFCKNPFMDVGCGDLHTQKQKKLRLGLSKLRLLLSEIRQYLSLKSF